MLCCDRQIVLVLLAAWSGLSVNTPPLCLKWNTDFQFKIPNCLFRRGVITFFFSVDRVCWVARESCMQAQMSCYPYIFWSSDPSSWQLNNLYPLKTVSSCWNVLLFFKPFVCEVKTELWCLSFMLTNIYLYLMLITNHFHKTAQFRHSNYCFLLSINRTF